MPIGEAVVLTYADEADIETLVAIRIEAMRESLERIGRFNSQRARDRFTSGFSAADTRHINAGGERVGFVVVKHHVDHAHLDHLYVRLQHQGRKIGSTVLAQVIAEANARNVPVRVGALRASDANRFYLQHGFQLVAADEFDNYYIRPCDSAATSK